MKHMKHAPLFSKDSNAPDNGEAYWIRTSDGVQLRVASWASKAINKGTIFHFSGISSFIERNAHTVANFSDLGFSNFVIDWRGHGLSDKALKNSKTVHISKFTDYQKDVDAMVSTAHKLGLPRPWYLVAKSMGAAIGLRAIKEGMPVDKCVFTAPMWGIQMNKFNKIISLPTASAFRAIGLGHLYVPGHSDESAILKNCFEENDLTHDRKLYSHLQYLAQKLPDLHTGGPSMSWLSEALLECHKISKMKMPSIPGLVFMGEFDETVELLPAKNKMTRWNNGNFHYVKGAKHDLLSECMKLRRPVLDTICDFFENG